MERKMIDAFSTCRCLVYVWETEYEILNEKIYCILSVSKRDNSSNIRFGNKVQIESIINCYTRLQTFKLD